MQAGPILFSSNSLHSEMKSRLKQTIYVLRYVVNELEIGKEV